MSKNIIDIDFYSRVAELLKEARKSVVQTVNKTMVDTYFEIGRMIVEEEQNGKEHAEYGKQILKELSNHLSTEFGKGFSLTNLQQMKIFYNVYGKQQTVSAKSENAIVQNENLQLSWS
jgi:predicted GNAT family N-acyltransferase